MNDDVETPLPPRKGDVLYGKGAPPGWSANVNITWGDPEVGYTEGYRRGARLLVEHVIDTQQDQDYLVYPILFLYRHHIELALKNMILRAPYLMGRPLTDKEKQHANESHCLEKLWMDLKPMLAAISKTAGWGKVDQEDIDGIDSYIHQLKKLDSGSYSFRYTRGKNGTPALATDLKYINLSHIAELIERLADYLDTLDMATSVLEERMMECEIQWRNA